ncbi:type I-E CRISPR-associated protein Cas5/CasD [Azospirillum halopraeferens]|uniref:type I-E CRISPR-associated protein Cas5/CasD n=1 Tax=Azospirillum halopraeferens TaxID=34010 RepID=UPI000412BAFF|nr:type I-E CRISPR-associated protein Cas5/CasD [Azospirillum halopraeferens]
MSAHPTGTAFPQVCFTLMAPYGAWGAASLSSATTAWKATESDPPKSALIGLLGAALGLERGGLAALSAALRVAVRTGIRPVRDPRPDFHTVSRARRPEGRGRWSRFEEVRPALAGQEHTGALLSKREYWSCGLWTVALAAVDPDAAPPDRLAAALASPRWPLYAGRKSCTPGLPPDPEIVTAAGPAAALAAYGWPWQRRPAMAAALAPLIRWKAERGETETLAWDEDYPGAPEPGDGHTVRAVRRRDLPDPLPLDGGRIYQRFRERTERRAVFPAPPDEAEAT